MTETLSVILIAHDEEQAIGPMLEGLLATYDREILEVIVVDDASRDRTAEIVENWAKRNPKVLLDSIERENCDGVIGSRFVGGGKVVRYPFLKRVANRLFHRVIKMLFGVRQNDLTNNFKLYKADIFRSMPWQSDSFAMNAETGLLPVLFGYNLIEVPVVWVDRNPEMGRSKFGLFKQGGGYIRVIFHAARLFRLKKKARARS